MKRKITIFITIVFSLNVCSLHYRRRELLRNESYAYDNSVHMYVSGHTGRILGECIMISSSPRL